MHVPNSLHKYGNGVNGATKAHIENIPKTAGNPFQSCTGPTKNYPNILPKPASPSQIPDIVATALRFLCRSWFLPMSHMIIAMTIVAPFSKI